MTKNDPHNLQRFIIAQEKSYATALGELEAGQKRTHWVWYIFPQVAGLGHSPTARHFGIQSKDEAIAYLAHPILGTRLLRCCEMLLLHQGEDVHDIMGYPDDLKLCSSMTLFACISEADSVFHKILAAFYAGLPDELTMTFVATRT